MDQLSVTKAVQIAGITSSAFLSGFTASVSLCAMSAIEVAPPSVLVRQYARVYEIGSTTSPKIAVASVLCFLYLAAQAARTATYSAPLYLYTVASVLVASIVPYTLIFMKPTNDLLHGKARAVEAGGYAAEDAEIGKGLARLMSDWKALNYVRAALVGAGAVCGAVAMALS